MTIKYEPDVDGWLATDDLGNTGAGATKAEALRDLKREIESGDTIPAAGQHTHRPSAQRRERDQCNSSPEQERRAPFDGNDVIRDVRGFILGVWRKRYLGRKAHRGKLKHILATPRLADVLERYETRGAALRSMVYVVPTLCGLKDALGYREGKEKNAYKDALATVTDLILKLEQVGPLVSPTLDPVLHLKEAAVTIAVELDYVDWYLAQLPIRPEHVGTRGGASNNEATLTGSVTRALDGWIPDDIPERAAFIAALMRAAGHDTYKQKVSSTIRRYREDKKRPH